MKFGPKTILLAAAAGLGLWLLLKPKAAKAAAAGKSAWRSGQDVVTDFVMKGIKKGEVREIQNVRAWQATQDKARVQGMLNQIRADPVHYALEWHKAITGGDLRLAAEWQEDFAAAGLNPRQVLLEAGYQVTQQLTMASSSY